MMKFKEVAVTPHMAAKWLDKNESNRNLAPKRVGAYARDMADGNWHLTPAAIVFNVKGDLLDGQHRLHAVIESGKTIRMTVAYGCDHDIRKYIDRGRGRTLSDRLRMEGVESNLTMKASVARALVYLDCGGQNILVTDDEATEAMEKYDRAFQWLDGATLKKGFKRTAYLSTILWALPLGGRVTEFHEGVQTGVGLKEHSPELAMHRYLAGLGYGGGSSSRTELLLKACACIHGAIEGRRMEKVYASNRGYLALAKMMKKRLPAEGSLVAI